MKKILPLKLILAFLLIFSFIFHSNATESAKASSNPSLTTKVTLYTGYENHQIKITNLSKSATVTYQSSDKKIATVTKGGRITPKAAGAATITVTIKQNKKTYLSKIHVTVKDPSLTITNLPNSVEIGDTYQLKGKAEGIHNASFSWTSSNKKFLEIDPQSGELTAKSEGDANITLLELNSGISCTLPIKVKKHKPLLLIYDFKSGIPDHVYDRSAKISAVKKNDSPSIYVTERKETWHGIQFDLSDQLKAGYRYIITAEVLQAEEDNAIINASLEINYSGNTSYPSLEDIVVPKNKWVKFEKTTTVPEFEKLYFYLQSPKNTMNFYVRNVQIKEISTNVDKVMEYDSLYSMAADYGFTLGTVINYDTLHDSGFRQIAQKHFNSLSAANEMKAYSLLDQDASISNAKSGDGMPRMNYTKADAIMDFAAKNGIKVRGHNLVWQESMVDWFFREGYTSDGKYVSREIMLQRLESYIQQVVTHFDNKYPGVIYAWDVVNEAVGTDIWGKAPSGDYPISMGDKSNIFYRQIGADYVKKSFEYARKYVAEGVKLFYNDWGCELPERRNAIIVLIRQVNAEKQLIDGIGMETYQEIDDRSLVSYPDKNGPSILDAMMMYHDLGIDIHVTELTIISSSAANNKAQADYGYKLMELIKEVNKEEKIISNVTIWGIMDLNLKPGDYGYPNIASGLLTSDLQPKPLFDAVYRSLKGK